MPTRGAPSRLGYATTALLTGLLLAGCSTLGRVGGSAVDAVNDGGVWAYETLTRDDPVNLPTELEGLESSIGLKRLWRQNIGSGGSKLALKLHPTLLADGIYTAGSDGQVAVYDLASGKPRWRVNLGQKITSGAGAGEGRVAVTTHEGELIALDGETGKTLWRAELGTESLSPPALSNGRILVQTIDGQLRAFGAESGEEQWLIRQEPPVLTLRGTARPVAAGSDIITGFANGKLLSVNISSGQIRWEAAVGLARGRTELERMIDIDIAPLVSDGTIFAASFQGRVASVGESSGEILWAREMSVHADLVADYTALYVTDTDSHIWALDRRTGSTYWQQNALAYRQLTGGAIIGELLAVGDFEGYIHLLSPDTGTITGRSRIASEPIIWLQATDDTLYATTTDGDLLAMQIIE
ncbi:MAG: outer membrane protein assembly factor BamB [Gammaproteobacteria bacterium]|nr:outer membrane protein assembly factor BamB [Gammaproteobacteria bacterium]